MTKIIPLVSALFFSLFLQAQTNFSGIINDYTAVTNIEQCEAIINVADASAFSPGMSVLIIQMQGAKMIETNASNFGDLVDLRSAGLYERNEILSISGNQIMLRYSLLNAYDLDGAVQLISIPIAENTGTISATVTAQPWNGSTGGVVVLDGGSRLTFNADIDVSGQGFRGGEGSTFVTDSCSAPPNSPALNFAYGLNNWRGAQKGEGIAAYIEGREAGKGKQLNGGGGANDYRGGGGGGSHHSQGGFGGEFTGNDGCRNLDPRGIGGILLPEDSTRLFMGGGGGGGHSNDGNAGNGGNGGGIVIVIADEINGGGTVRVSGLSGGDATDGAGGGGAAGSSFLFASTFNGLVLVEANGGNGGNADSQNSPSCSGPGGGGSGGRTYYGDGNGVSAPGLSGGNPGIVLNSTSGCVNNGATRGFPGRQFLRTTFPENLVESPAVDDVMIADCGNPTGSSVQFNIDYPAAEYFEFQVGRNNSPFSPQDSTNIDSLIFSNLNPLDSMTILIRAVGSNGCSSAFDTVSCVVLSCTGIAVAAETNVDTLYCLDDPEVMLEADIEGGVFSIEGVEDSTLSPSELGIGRFEVTYTYFDSVGCQRVDPYPTRIATVAEAPSVNCSSVSDNSVSFAWNDTADKYRIIATVNGTPSIIPIVTEDNTITFDDLNPGDSVQINLVALGVGPCGDSPLIQATCTAQDCRMDMAEIAPLASAFCPNEAGVQVNATPAGGTFRGLGIDATGFFNPANVDIPADSSSVQVEIVYEVASDPNCPPLLDTIFTSVLALPDTAIVTCDSVAQDLVRFAWTHPTITTFNIEFSINGGGFMTENDFVGNTFTVDGLNPEDEVEILVTPINPGLCGNPNGTSFTCTAAMDGCGDGMATINNIADGYCISEEEVQLIATPTGGTFSGDGITDESGIFDPSAANLGSNVITYEFTDAMGCLFQDTVVTEVFSETPAPIANDCDIVNSGQINISWSHPTLDSFSYSFFINNDNPEGPFGTNDTVVEFRNLMAGDMVSFSVQAISEDGCGDSAMTPIFCTLDNCADNPPTILNLEDTYCVNDEPFTLEADPMGGIFFNRNIPIIDFDPADIGVGTHTIIYNFIDAGGCTQRTSQTVTIVDVIPPPEIVCGDSTAQSLEFTWDNPNNSLFQYNVIIGNDTILTDSTSIGLVSLGGLSPADSALIELIPLDESVCVQTASTQVCYTVECNNEVNAVFDLEDSYCLTDTDIDLNATPLGGIFSGDGVDPEGSFNPSLAGTGELTIFYEFTDDVGCPFQDSFTTNIVLAPVAPVVSCGDATSSSASFNWTHPDENATFSYAVSLDGVNYSPEIESSDTTYTQTSLDQNSEIFFRIFTVGPTGCGNSDTLIINCATNNCAPLDLNINVIDDICLGLTNEIIDLETDLPDSISLLTTVWSGDGIVDPEEGFFDPTDPNLTLGANLVRFEGMTADGCTYSTSTSINVNLQPTVEIEMTDEINCQDSLIFLNTNGTNMGESTVYEWTTDVGNIVTGGTDSLLVINRAGTYFVEVANGDCVAIDSVEVLDNRALPIADAGLDQSLSCAVDSVMLGGDETSEGANLIYRWTGPGDFESDEQFINVRLAGTYTLVVEDTVSLCLSESSSVEVSSIPDSVMAMANVSGLLTCVNNSVTLDASPSFGIGDLQYQWSDDNSVVSPFSTNPDLTVTEAGSYVLEVQDEGGCTASSVVVVGEDLVLPFVDAGADQNIGCLLEEARLGGKDSDMGSNFVLSWSGGEINGLSELNPIVSSGGSYVLTILNTQNGCENSDTVMVTANDDLITNLASTITKPFCFEDLNGSIQIDSVIGGTPPYLFSINGNGFSTLQRFGNLAPATYQIEVRDAEGCTFETAIEVEAPLELQATLSADQQVTLGDSTIINLIINPNPDSIIQINWVVNDSIACEGCLELGLSPTEKTTILVEIEDVNGCTAKDLVTLFVERNDQVFKPTAFSPNGDNINDLFFLSAGNDVESIDDLKIFDRWGMLVFQQTQIVPNDPRFGWDGTFQGTPLNPAVFVYRAVITYKDGRTKVIVGDVALVK
ncbi:MAG: gliding motility-associated C-terminal domain-containing protein [Bacteroidota bacterium]